MTGLLAGSLLALVLASFTLAIGWVSSNGVFVWFSIAGSITTGLLLALAYSRARQEALIAARRSNRGATRASSAGYATAPMPAARSRARTSPTDGAVVAVPDRRKFHKADCRYARVRGAERMSKSAARRAGYEPCGICKP